ncbi:hypothetical protein [Streptomyces chryseus]|uniref:Uncharacterized protein n=1 Tax=Streptomyces chryseus TaxID=68186 RepID=A0ABQ3EF07_9ACTN|nr:hypothetical protein [Streptomyces chryseus]GHB32701.1 hypothetical protein GCM10010346_64940 [Streptomyces chryseus]
MTTAIGTTDSGSSDDSDSREEPGSSAVPVDAQDGGCSPVISPSEHDWIQAAAELYVFAERRGLRIVRADGPNADLLTQAMVFEGVLLFPPDRHPRDVLRDVGVAPGMSC